MKKKDLDFTIYCVGVMAESLGCDARDVYRLMQKGNIIMGYIVPCFDVLHSFSRDYIIEDLTRLMKKKGLLANMSLQATTDRRASALCRIH